MPDRPAHLSTTWGQRKAHGAHAADRPSPRPRPTPGPATGPWPGVPTAEMRSIDEPAGDVPTASIGLPPRVVGGPLGVDSPIAEASLRPDRWHAWWDLTDARRAGRPVRRDVLELAMGRPLEALWGLGWLTHHHALGRSLMHLARVYSHDSGETLVSACLLTAAWVGPSDNVRPLVQLPRDLPVARCTVCSEAVGTGVIRRSR